MYQNSAAYLAKVDHAVKTLLKAPGLSVPEAMKLADFSKSVIADENVRRAIRRRLPGGTKKGLTATCAPPVDIVCDNQMVSSMSPLTTNATNERRTNDKRTNDERMMKERLTNDKQTTNK